MFNMEKMWRRKLEKERRFNADHGLYMLFWIFLLGSVGGFVLEGVWSVVRWGGWQHHTGVVWGPFCTVYGLGAAAMYVAVSLLPAREMPRWKTVLARFLACALAGTLAEYLVSFFQEMWFGSLSWDYSAQKWNIGGRVSAGMSMIWGTVGLLFMQIVCPAMRALISRVNGQKGYIATWALVVFMGVNLLVSAAAVDRWRERGENIPPQSAMDIKMDEHFGDERMERLFPNMQFCEPGTYSYADHAA